MTQVIPDTESVEVAKIALALHLLGNTISGDDRQNARRFAQVYKFLDHIIGSQGDLDIDKLLETIYKRNK